MPGLKRVKMVCIGALLLLQVKMAGSFLQGVKGVKDNGI